MSYWNALVPTGIALLLLAAARQGWLRRGPLRGVVDILTLLAFIIAIGILITVYQG